MDVKGFPAENPLENSPLRNGPLRGFLGLLRLAESVGPHASAPLSCALLPQSQKCMPEIPQSEIAATNVFSAGEKPGEKLGELLGEILRVFSCFAHCAE